MTITTLSAADPYPQSGCGAASHDWWRESTDDHEIAYLLLQYKIPEYVRVQVVPKAMAIQARIDEGCTVAAE